MSLLAQLLRREDENPASTKRSSGRRRENIVGRNVLGVRKGGCGCFFLRAEKSGERTARGVEEADGEEREENGGNPAAFDGGLDDDVGEEEAKEELDERSERFDGFVAAFFDVHFALLVGTVFGGADEGGFVVEDCFEYGFGVVNGHADAEGEEKREVGDFFPPCFGAESFLSGEVEQGYGDGREEKDRAVEQVVLEGGEFDGAVLIGVNQEAEANEEEIGKIGCEVSSRFHFAGEWGITSKDGWEDFFADLNGAFGPAVLLAFEAVHINRKLGGSIDVVKEDEAPAFELGAVAEIHVLGEGVVIPTACVGDGGFAPDASGAVESEEASAAVARGLFELHVAVEEHGLDAGEDVVGAIEMLPARLNEADFVVGEVVDGFLEDVWVRDEIGVEDEEVFSFGELGAVLESSCFEAGAVGAVNVIDIKSLSTKTFSTFFANFYGFVGRIV